MIEYKIGEAAEDVNDSVIEKTGHVTTFTLREVRNSILMNEKTKKELEGRAILDSAKMTNIEQNHPFVLEMSEQDLFTAHMYMEAKATARVCKQKAEQLAKAIEEDTAEIAVMLEKMPELVPVEPEAEINPNDK